MLKRVKLTVRTASAEHPLGIRSVARWWNGDAIHLSGPAVIRAETITAGAKKMTNVYIELPSGTLINVTSEGKAAGPFTVSDLRQRIAGLPGDMILDIGGAESVLSLLSLDATEKPRLAAARPAEEAHEVPKPRPVEAHDDGDENDGEERGGDSIW
jgi:hypothetical protein